MAIVSSAITKNRNDGFARFIEETHIDSTGANHILRRHVPHGYDTAADLATHAEEIADFLAAQEAEVIING
jgi:hypothetical protein